MLNIEMLSGFNTSPMATYLKVNTLSTDLLGVSLRPDISKPEFGLHRVLKSAPAENIEGVDYQGFEYLRGITPAEFANAQDKIIDMFGTDPETCNKVGNHAGPEVETFLNLFTPAFFQQSGETVLGKTTEQLVSLDSSVDYTEIEPMVGLKELPAQYQAPIAFLPHDSHFDSKLNDLKISDILTIFPEAEAKLLALSIGRALVGPDRTTTVVGRKNISHAFRTFCLVYGAPGTGKSTLFDFLFDAIESTGYTVAHFNDLGQQFGLNEIVNANFAYSDDLLTNTLKELLQSPLFKQMITSGKIRAHVKFCPDLEVRSTATFFSCINDFNASVLNFLDGGTLSRLAILSTKSNREITVAQGSGLTANSPNLRTRENIEWLTKSLGLDRKAVMLKFARLCADLFWIEVEAGTLESTINELKRNLRTQLHEGLESSVIQLLQFSYLLVRNKSDVPQLNGANLELSFKSLDIILNDDRANYIRNIIKGDWEDLGRPNAHIYTAVKLLDNISVANICKTTPADLILRDPVKAIKAYWADLRLCSGFNVASNVPAIRQTWGTARAADTQDALTLIAKCKNHEMYKIIISPDTEANTGYLFLEDYDRERHIDRLNATL